MAQVVPYQTAHGKRYRVRYRTPDRRQTDKRGFRTKREAELFAATVEVSKAKGEYVAPSLGRMTVGELAADWLARKQQSTAPSHYRMLESAWRVHVARRWAAVSVSDIDQLGLEAWISWMVREGCGATTVLRAHGVLSGILADAVKARRLAINPCRGIDNLPRKTARRHVYLSADDVELPGRNLIHFYEPDWRASFQEVAEFLTGEQTLVADDRVLATVLFTDIVDSTRRASEIGDRDWHALLDAHDAIVRSQLARFRGREVNKSGDGFLAMFDGPQRAIRCAMSIRDAVQALGIQVRAGLHTGECEVRGDDIGGIGVHIGARVSALAGPNDVLVSSTLRDLVIGSGLEFDERGAHALKGVPGEWRLFAVATP